MLLKKINDYYEKLLELYPEVSLSDIKKILNYGWKQVYLLNSYGGDLIITEPNWIYFGRLTYDSVKHFHYYRTKLATKIRVLYKRKNIPWDGYYYFALTEEQYQNYLKQKNKKGHPRKYFKFDNVYLYRILDELKVREYNKKYVFRISGLYPLKYLIHKKDCKLSNFELIEIKPVYKFKDILVLENKYDTLWAKKLQPTFLVRG